LFSNEYLFKFVKLTHPFKFSLCHFLLFSSHHIRFPFCDLCTHDYLKKEPRLLAHKHHFLCLLNLFNRLILEPRELFILTPWSQEHSLPPLQTIPRSTTWGKTLMHYYFIFISLLQFFISKVLCFGVLPTSLVSQEMCFQPS
jgi:hypothetical protein